VCVCMLSDCEGRLLLVLDLCLRLVCTAFAGAIAIFIIVECLRYTRIPPFGDAIHTFMQHYLDSRDTGPVVLTHMYLLMGW